MALLELTALTRSLTADVVVYVDHGFRPETVAEAATVRAAAERHGAEFRSAKLVIDRRDEAALREARYAALGKIVEESGATFLLMGHTRDDQIETILHRLVRGAGRRGLAGMLPRRGTLVRPLLGIRREELRAFLSERGLSWREDPSNREARYFRNRLRNSVIPGMERELGRGCLDHLPDMAALWAEEEAYLEREAARFGTLAERGAGSNRRLETGALLAAPAALRTRIVRRWLAAVSGRPIESFTRAELERLLELARGRRSTRTLDLAGVTVVASHGELSASAPAALARPPESARSPLRRRRSRA